MVTGMVLGAETEVRAGSLHVGVLLRSSGSCHVGHVVCVLRICCLLLEAPLLPAWEKTSAPVLLRGGVVNGLASCCPSKKEPKSKHGT